MPGVPGDKMAINFGTRIFSFVQMHTPFFFARMSCPQLCTSLPTPTSEYRRRGIFLDLRFDHQRSSSDALDALVPTLRRCFYYKYS
jgi:hypothetical protein